MKQLNLLLLLIAIFVQACGQESSSASHSLDFTTLFRPPILGDAQLEHNPNAFSGLPDLKEQDDQLFISRSSYLLLFAPKRRGIHWAAWRLQASDLGTAERQNNYSLDTELESYLKPRGLHAVAPSEYKGSCYDRGHQVPSADRARTVEENRVTFFMSNMMPQTPYLNRVVWRNLESYERELVRSGKTLIIFSGGIYDRPTESIGPRHDIAVPEAFFKIIAEAGSTDLEPRIVAAVIMPNMTSSGFRAADDHAGLCADDQTDDLAEKVSAASVDWRKYLTTLAEIERRSGLTWPFLHNIDP